MSKPNAPRQRETVLVPEAAADADPVGLARFLDVVAVALVLGADQDVLPELLVAVVDAPFIGQDPGNACFEGGVEELRLLLVGSGDSHGDEEGVNALESGDDGGVVSIVDGLLGDAGRDLRFAVGAHEGGDFVA